MTLAINLNGKKGLIFGIANDHSIAYGCARYFQMAGAELAVTYLNDKAEPYVRPLADQVGASLILPCDLQEDAQLNKVFEQIAQHWGSLDFILHSVAWGPVQNAYCGLLDSTRADFLRAMDISCHSFARLARLAATLMPTGGSLLTVSYMGSHEVVDHYNVMGPVKAALESTTQYLAAELGELGIRVNAISPGPMRTRAASGLAEFDTLLARAKEKSALHRNIELADAGALAAFLVSDLAKNITGGIHVVDAGYQMMD